MKRFSVRRTPLRRLKTGDAVAVCYDGEWGRAVRGTVLAVHVLNRSVLRMRVRFNAWAGGQKGVEHVFRSRAARTDSPDRA